MTPRAVKYWEQQHALEAGRRVSARPPAGESLVCLRKITLFREEVPETLWMLLEKKDPVGRQPGWREVSNNFLRK